MSCTSDRGIRGGSRHGTLKWKKAGRVFELVLYGSYARGDWVDDPIGANQSDYDILIVVNDERLGARADRVRT